MEPVVIVEPVLQPVTLSEVKAHCKIDVADAEQDSLLDLYIAAARDYIEWVTKRTFHVKTLQITLDCWPCSGVIELPWATPLVGITRFRYRDSNENWADVDSSIYFTLTGGKKEWGRIVLKSGSSWPSSDLSPLGAIQLEYEAGLAVLSPIVYLDDTAKRANLELIARMFDMPEAEVITDRASIEAVALQFGLNAILDRMRAKHEF